MSNTLPVQFGGMAALEKEQRLVRESSWGGGVHSYLTLIASQMDEYSSGLTVVTECQKRCPVKHACSWTIKWHNNIFGIHISPSPIGTLNTVGSTVITVKRFGLKVVHVQGILLLQKDSYIRLGRDYNTHIKGSIINFHTGKASWIRAPLRSHYL